MHGQLSWIELDEFEDFLGAPEVETLPTVVILKDDSVLFVGPIKPKIEAVIGLISATREQAPIPEHRELGRDLLAWLVKRSA